jgi:hypothetical protein
MKFGVVFARLDGHRAHVDHLADVKAAIDARFGS